MDTLTETATKEIYISQEEVNIAKHLANIDSTLVPYAKTLAKPPYKDLSNPEAFERNSEHLELTDLIAVHLTNTFPENGIIHPTVYYNPNILRFSLHFAINSVVTDFEFCGYETSWKDRQYAILIPLKNIKTRIEEFNPGETIILDELLLPEGTVILKDKDDSIHTNSGNAQVIEADYSCTGEKLNGMQRACYEQMIEMGYFPQTSANECWAGWGFWQWILGDFCKENNFKRGAGHRHHWSWKLEEFSEYIERIVQEKDGEEFAEAVNEAKENLLDNEAGWYAPEIPEKYKQVLIKLLQKYGQQFPEVELPNLD